MRIEQLKYYLAVAEAGSINAASQHLFVSQQGISDALRRMENELGLTLFKRSKTGVVLSNEGRNVLTYVQEIIDRYSTLENYVFDIHHLQSDEIKRSLTILSNPLSTNLMIPDLIDLAGMQFPQLSLRCSDASITEMVAMTREQKADASLFLLLQCDIARFMETLSADLRVFKLFGDELVACVAASSPLGSKKYLTAAEFKALPRSSYNSSYGSYDTMHINDSSMYLSNNAEFHLKLMLQKNVATITASYFFAKTFPADLVTAIPIKPAFKISYYVIIATRTPPDELKNFLQLLAEYVKHLTGQTVQTVQYGR